MPWFLIAACGGYRKGYLEKERYRYCTCVYMYLSRVGGRGGGEEEVPTVLVHTLLCLYFGS